MYPFTRILLFLSCFLLSISLYASPNYYDQDGYNYKQKLILLQGKTSRLIDGHSRPRFNFNKKEALPYYLSRGWNIQHIYFDKSDMPGIRNAYVVIEKWIKIDDRLSRR
jgi:hypothetical protein